MNKEEFLKQLGKVPEKDLDAIAADEERRAKVIDEVKEIIAKTFNVDNPIIKIRSVDPRVVSYYCYFDISEAAFEQVTAKIEITDDMVELDSSRKINKITFRNSIDNIELPKLYSEKIDYLVVRIETKSLVHFLIELDDLKDNYTEEKNKSVHMLY